VRHGSGIWGHTGGKQSGSDGCADSIANELQCQPWRLRLLPVGDAAAYVGVSRATVERLVYRGELPIVKVAGSTRYDAEDLDGYIEINRSRNRNRTA
jgi:excisionase family DNA binding protein